jgi:hypothetical protein
MVIRKPQRSETKARRPQVKKLSIWEEIAEMGKAIPDEVIARMPRDGAKNFDHYLHGSPKQK